MFLALQYVFLLYSVRSVAKTYTGDASTASERRPPRYLHPAQIGGV